MDTEQQATTPEVTQPEAAKKQGPFLSRSKVKKYALLVSKTKRAGKFTRVGESFYIGVETEVEGRMRTLGGPEIDGKEKPLALAKFVTPVSRKRMLERLEDCVANVIHGKVMRHPSVGITLKD